VAFNTHIHKVADREASKDGDNTMSLEEQIAAHSATVQTQSYSMSLSEIVAMYRDGELGLHPEFQRFFRWTQEQKSRLVESLLLGIPVPPIFVSERPDGKWDVIDGLQRLSTILELMGELQDEDGNRKPRLQLTRTHYLPALEGLYWSDQDHDTCLPDSSQIRIKRARLDVNIVRSTSDEDVKYEVFQRLNTGGSKATDQEVRNCLLVMTNPEHFRWLKGLSEYPGFRETLSLTDRALDEAYDMELVSRYLVFIHKEPAQIQRIDELGAYLNHESVVQAQDTQLDRDALRQSFATTFDFLASELKENSFRRFDAQRQRYVGPMSASLFEVVAVGLGHWLKNGGVAPDVSEFSERHRGLWNELGPKPFVGSGVRASTRIPETIRFGREWIAR
jgi:hypothetical protein